MEELLFFGGGFLQLLFPDSFYPNNFCDQPCFSNCCMYCTQCFAEVSHAPVFWNTLHHICLRRCNMKQLCTH